MSLNAYRKFLAFGTGAGIEIGARDLTVTVVRVRPSGASITGAYKIENFAERPAGDWGAEYTRFVKQKGAGHVAASVLLPRHDVIVRQLAMPGVNNKDLEQAVRFQIDGLHPFSEEDAIYDYARIGNSPNVLIGITRRDVVGRYVSLFAEAGIKVSAFTFSAAVLYSSLRLLSAGPEGGFLAIEERGTELEVYGESEARPVYSTTFDVFNAHAASRALAQSLSELRLPLETQPQLVSAALPAPSSKPEGLEFATVAMTYATALSAACPRLSLRTNLLPPELRTTSSRAIYIPSIMLGALLLLGLGGLALYGSWEDRKYRDALNAEMTRLKPIASRPMAIDREITVKRQRTQLLDNFRKRTRADLDALNELTKLLPPPGWVMSMEISRDQVRLNGETDQAVGLLRSLDQSPMFEGSDFAMPLARSAIGDTFSIRARREGALP